MEGSVDEKKRRNKLMFAAIQFDISKMFFPTSGTSEKLNGENVTVWH
jgi:hypothetical protein